MLSKGYTHTGKTFTNYDLMLLMPSQMLAIRTAGGELLHIRPLPTSGRIFVNDTPCLTEVGVRRSSAPPVGDGIERVMRLVTCLIEVDQFWLYGIDHSSHRVKSISLLQMAT